MAFQLTNPELITPAILHKTSVPFLTPEASQSTNGQTINVSVCSEFKQYSIPATPIDGQHKLCITLDGDHQPMIFTVGNDSVRSSHRTSTISVANSTFGFSDFTARAIYLGILGGLLTSRLPQPAQK